MTRPRVWLPAAGLLILSVLVYGRHLTSRPLLPTELTLQERVATLANGPAGNVRLFQRSGNGWIAPVPLVAAAGLRWLLPSASNHVRLASAAFGIVDVLLLYALVVRCLRQPVVAFAAGLLLLLTPSHVLAATTGASGGIWSAPFILCWATGLTALSEPATRNGRLAFGVGTASLLAGVYADLSVALMVPFFLIATASAFQRTTDWSSADLRPAAVVSALAMLPAVVWCLGASRAEMVDFARWLLEPADVRSIFRASTVLKGFWDFFRPSHLFLAPTAPGLCGVFLAGTVVPVAVGVCALVGWPEEKNVTLNRLRPSILVAAVLGPLVAAMATQPLAEGLAVIVAPVGVLVAATGATAMYGRGGLLGRFLLAAAVVVVAVQARFCLR